MKALNRNSRKSRLKFRKAFKVWKSSWQMVGTQYTLHDDAGYKTTHYIFAYFWQGPNSFQNQNPTLTQSLHPLKLKALNVVLSTASFCVKVSVSWIFLQHVVFVISRHQPLWWLWSPAGRLGERPGGGLGKARAVWKQEEKQPYILWSEGRNQGDTGGPHSKGV